MGLLDDTCDYCKKQYDPMGNDIRRTTIPPLVWCGVCDEGLQSVFGALTDEQLRLVIDASDEATNKLGKPHEMIDALNKKYKDKVPEQAIRLYWELLRMEEDAHFASRVLEARS